MTFGRSIRAAALAACAWAVALPAAADVVTDWIDLGAASFAEARRAPGFSLGPRQAQWRSRTALALFEALNAVDRRYQSYLNVPPAAGGAPAELTAAVAAHRVLLDQFPDQRPRLDAALRPALDAVPDGPAETAAVRAGEAAAAAVQAAGGPDPAARIAQYRFHTTPGRYVTTALPVIPIWTRGLKPWLLTSASQFRPKGPPALSDPRYARDLDEVRRVGARGGGERTPEQTRLAYFWGSMDEEFILREIAARPGRTPVQNARLFALHAMVLEDANLANAEAKFHFNFWRPITAIRMADEDGVDVTQPVPDWESQLTTPLHPEYPCAHCTLAAAIQTVLEPDAGADTVYAFTAPSVPALTRRLPLRDYVREVSQSRIYGGVHYRFSTEDGETLGREIGRYALQRFARPLPPS